MKKVRTVLLFATLAAILLLTACRTASVYNVNNAAIPSGQEKPLTMAQIEKAIVLAGSDLGWVMQADKPGHIIGTLNVRSHMAAVDVTYDENSYSINYKNSTNLKYTGSTIHSQYNNWVKYLSQAIDSQISAAKYQ
ncbi:hypothetical protein [Pseudodesulfovibrio sediminis]|uniref:Lipoprotein n=1 Tax=Pseudodesulfovibrio sediminis TaxID=2810563 RepID=A0ABN6ETE3_9BACT|nr:hypothetical protein [Pseudodesulfovibrio sediminis]BCS88439.1 hypothetical protein PSDVSF_16810 [Pseudodesulfovibrio sediminis]